MLLIAFPLAVLSLTMAVTALVQQVGDSGNPNTPVALNKSSQSASPSPSASVSAVASAVPTEQPLPSLAPLVEPSAVIPSIPSVTVTATETVTVTVPSYIPAPTVTVTAAPKTDVVTQAAPTPATATKLPTIAATPIPQAGGQPASGLYDPMAVIVTSNDTGTGDLKNRLVPILSGTAPAGATISIEQKGTRLALFRANKQGVWTSGPLTGVGTGVATVDILSTAADGTSSWTWTSFNLDGPSVLVSPRDDTGFSLSVSDKPNTTFEVLRDGQPLLPQQTTSSTGTWSGVLPTLNPGTWTIGVRVIAGERPGPAVNTTVRVY
jgi:hypothetical protein